MIITDNLWKPQIQYLRKLKNKYSFTLSTVCVCVCLGGGDVYKYNTGGGGVGSDYRCVHGGGVYMMDNSLRILSHDAGSMRVGG